MGAACPRDAAEVEGGAEEDGAGVATLGDALARYRAQRPQRERRDSGEEGPGSAAGQPPQGTPARAPDEHDARREGWSAEAAKKKREEEEEEKELEHLIHRVMMQKVSLETTGHQKIQLLEDKATDAHGADIKPGEFFLTDVGSLIAGLDSQNHRLLEPLYQARRTGDRKHGEQPCEADGVQPALESEAVQAPAEALGARQRHLDLQPMQEKLRG